MKIKLITLIFIGFSVSILSQELSTIVDLKKKLQYEIVDTTKVSLNLMIADSYLKINKDSAFYFNNQALTLANKSTSKKHIANSLFAMANYFEISNNYLNAIKLYKESLLIFEELNYQEKVAKINNDIGLCYIQIYEEDIALGYYLKALSIFKSIDSRNGVANVYSRIGDIFYNEENYEYANKYFKDALAIYVELKSKSGIANAYTNIGNATADSGDYEKGLELYQKSIEIQLAENELYGVAINYNNIGDSFIKLKEYKKAEDYLFKALKISKDLNEKNLEAIVLLNISDIENKLHHYNSAIIYANKSLNIANNIGSLEYELENLQNLAKAYEGLGKISVAYNFHKKYEKVKDSFVEIDKTKKVELFHTLNKLQKSQFTIDELANENKITQLKYENERKFIYFLIGAILLFGFFVVLLILQQTAKKNAFNLLEYKNHQINKMNEEIQIQSDNLRQLNKTKDTFFSIIAHDLRSPFNSIEGFTDLMIENRHEYDEEKRLKFLNIIKGSTSKASSLLDNLLIWANSQSENIEFNPQKVNLIKKVSDVLALLEIQAINKEIKIFNNVDHNLFLAADSNMLETVLRNLISNAIKFTNLKGEIQISSAMASNFLEISVKDNGVGISQSDIDDLFSIEVKNSNVGTANEHGSGLGLILCKDFVEKHGGKLWVQSFLNEGSEFKFTIPIAV